MSVAVEREYLETGAFARDLGVAVETVRLWERQGKIAPAARTSTGRLLFSRDQVEEVRARRATTVRGEPPRDAA